MVQQNNLALAKQGDLKAFVALMNYYLQPKGITAKAALKDKRLQFMLESNQVPDQQTMVLFVRRGITTNFGANLIERVKVYGRQIGEEFPAWSQEFELLAQTNSHVPPVSPSLPIANSKTQGATSHTIPAAENINYSSHLSTGKAVLAQPKTKPGQIALYYFAGVLLIFGVLISSNAENSALTWSVVIFVVACLVAISTPQGRAFITKHSQETTEATMNQQLTVFADLQKKHQRADLDSRSLLKANEKVIFCQTATYRGGIRGYPTRAQASGIAFVLDHSFVFYDKDMSFKVSYELLIEAKLDFFELGGVRGILALGDVGRQLQQTQNILELSYLDDENTERSAKFQIHGALTIPGEAEKAREFLNHLLEFKGQFTGKSVGNPSDPIFKLEKLKKLKEQGIISESEFEATKRKLLDQL